MSYEEVKRRVWTLIVYSCYLRFRERGGDFVVSWELHYKLVKLLGINWHCRLFRMIFLSILGKK